MLNLPFLYSRKISHKNKILLARGIQLVGGEGGREANVCFAFIFLKQFLTPSSISTEIPPPFRVSTEAQIAGSPYPGFIRWLVPIVIDKTVYNPINQDVGHARRHSDSICYCVCGKVIPATHRILILSSF